MSQAFLSCHNLRYTYEDGQAALAGVSVELKAGTRLALLGSNGAGKSSLLMSLAGLLDASMERCQWDEMNLCVRRSRDLTQHLRIGLLMQDPDHQLIAPSVLQDLMLGPWSRGEQPAELEPKARQYLRRFGLEAHENRSPHRLSLGQKKKLALAGLLIAEPQILLLDEPTVGLDGRGAQEFLAILHQELSPETMVIVATHDQGFVRAWANEVLILAEGRSVVQCKLQHFLQSSDIRGLCGFETSLVEERPWNPSLAHPYLSPS